MTRTYHLNGPSARTRLLDFISTLPLNGLGWDVAVQRHVKRRTANANSMLHVLFREFGSEFGWTDDDAKDFFKEKYGPKVRKVLGEEEYWLPKSTRQYTTQEAHEMIEHIHRVAVENGVMLSDPRNMAVAA